MLESNWLQAIHMDTDPALPYKNQTSEKIINLVNEINAEQEDGKNIVAYTLNASRHVFLFCLRQHESLIYNRLADQRLALLS